MNISHILIVSTDDENGKIAKNAGQMAFALLQRGFKVSILSSKEENSTFEGFGADVNLYHLKKKKCPLFCLKDALSTTLKEILKADQTIDLVHFIGLGDVTVASSNLCSALNVPHVVSAFEGQAFHLEKRPFWKRKKYLVHLDQFNGIVLPSQSLLEQAVKLNLDNLTLIKEGVNTERFKPVLSKRPVRRGLGLPESATLVCCMADIQPENKQMEALKLCMPLGEILCVLFVGKVKDPAYLESILREARRLAVEPYVIVKNTPDNPEDYLKASDVFMLLGGVEARQTTVLEAQSAGLPVVLSASESSLALTSGNKTGVVLYEGNVLARKAVEKLLSEPSFRQGRSIHARPFVKKEHDFQLMMDLYIRLYGNI